MGNSKSRDQTPLLKGSVERMGYTFLTMPNVASTLIPDDNVKFHNKFCPAEAFGWTSDRRLTMTCYFAEKEVTVKSLYLPMMFVARIMCARSDEKRETFQITRILEIETAEEFINRHPQFWDKAMCDLAIDRLKKVIASEPHIRYGFDERRRAEALNILQRVVSRMVSSPQSRE